MPGTRMLMRPWLEMQINANKIPGLQWLNKDEHTFQIPWKHAARHGWEMEKDACLFQKWAVHTGRYKVGEKKTDAKTWKANFRCALNSLPDIEEVKDQSVNKGSGAVRVFRMLPAVIKSDRKERKSSASKKKTINTDCEDKSLECRLSSTRSDSVDANSTLTDHSYSEQDMELNTTGLSLDLVTCEVGNLAELGHTVEVSLADSTNDMYPFQVSPQSSYTSEGEEADTIADEILEMMEPTIWLLDGKGYLSNETGKPFTDYSSRHSSPESEKVAGEIELRFSTDLTDSFINHGNWLDPEYFNYLPQICTS